MTGMKPSYQGRLDNLCGLYAIVNALQICGDSDKEATFKLACEALGKKRWPAVLWDGGVTFKDMQRMIQSCIKDNVSVQASYPFRLSPPKVNEKYWEKFDSIFEDSSVKCAITGVWNPKGHWVVITPAELNMIMVTDSMAKRSYLKDRAFMTIDSVRNKQNQWVIQPEELIIFGIRIPRLIEQIKSVETRQPLTGIHLPA